MAVWKEFLEWRAARRAAAQAKAAELLRTLKENRLDNRRGNITWPNPEADGDDLPEEMNPR